MRRASTIVGLELVLLSGAFAFAAYSPSAPYAGLDLLWFFAGLTVLKLSDVWLPRGDAVGMSSALALGALLMFDLRVLLGMLVVSELLALLPRGPRQKWTLAVKSIAAESVAGVVCSTALYALGLHPAQRILVTTSGALRPEQYAYLLSVGLLFASLEYVVLQTEGALLSGRPLSASLLSGLSYGAWLIAAQVSTGLLAALIYRTMGVWGLVVSVVMILVMRQSFSLLIEIRSAYNATVDVLIRAMEAQSPGREGVADRNASIATAVGRTVGLHGRELERLRYAALLLGVGDADEDQDSQEVSGGSSAKVIENVEFLSDVLPILQICDSAATATEARPSAYRRTDLVCAYVVMASGVAVGIIQEHKLCRLKERLSPRVMREVDDALCAVFQRVAS